MKIKPNVEEKWLELVALLVAHMKTTGVKSLKIELTERGTYKFEIDPITENQNYERNN